MTDAAPLRVAIVGLGVMGGSVAKALMRRAPHARIVGVDPDDESAALASRDGVVRARSLADCEVDGAVVVFAAPLDATVRLVRDTAAVWSRAALATDVASLKAPVVAAARGGAVGGSVFVGAHPMCGSERSGYATARADLFEGADVWLCPAGGGAAARTPLARAGRFWRTLGARPRTVAAEDHDRTMAWASHLPQLVANALAWSLEDAGVARKALGPGGRDMTRLAGSGAAMWLPLLEAAREADIRALTAVEERIGSLRRLLERGDLEALAGIMERGRRWVSTTD